MKNRLYLLLFATALPLAAAPATEFHGRLDPAVAIGKSLLTPVLPAPPEVIAMLPAAPGADDKVWIPKITINIKGTEYRAAIVATAAGGRTLWLDRNRDGRFGEGERWPFAAGETHVTLTLPWDNGIYREFPFYVQLRSEPLPRASARGGAAETPVAAPAAAPGPADLAGIVYNFNISFAGTVEIDGRPMRLEFLPRPAAVAIDPTQVGIGMDVNFDGKIDRAAGEVENPRGVMPVFRVGAHYLAVKSADVGTGEIVLEERPASEYTRFDAQPGQEMPDFTFVDFAGGRHKLADYRGKYVLLDFWGTWCGPCIEGMKQLDPVYRQYQPKGFEIIGMNMEKTVGNLSAADYAKDVEKARAFIAKAGHPWIQSTQESIERFALDVIHVNHYPTTILIDPTGRIVARDVHAEGLAGMLAKQWP